jgi:serine/threonine-protein kinase HipA
MKVPALNICWFDGSSVGQVRTPGHTEFGYHRSWLEAGHNLSPLKVPFNEFMYTGRDKDFDFLPGFLSDCLPDQWGNTIMARDFAAVGISPTPMKRLAWVGSRGIGALRFEPEMEEGASSSTWGPVTALLLSREAQAVLRKEPPEAYQHLRRAGTAGGAFPKANVALLPDGALLCSGNVAKAMPDIPGARLGIIKLDCEDDPLKPSTDGRMEAAYLEMARVAGLRTARCGVMSESDQVRERHHLFVERFDVDGAHRFHALTLAGALESYALTYRHLLEATRRLTADRREMEEVLRRMVFNVRTANADDHGKNHSFLYDSRTRVWRLSPAYDLTLNYSLERSFNGLFVTTFGANPQRSALCDVAIEFGFTSSEFDTLDEAVVGAVSRWDEFAAQVKLPEAERLRAAHLHKAMRTSLGALAAPKKTSRRRRII